jgi:hypothetical protein
MRRRTLRRLVRDERGIVEASVYMLLMLFVIGIGVVGFSTFRSQLVQQYGDLAVALSSLNQSYSFTVGTMTSIYTDPGTTLTDPMGQGPAGINVTVPPMYEN